MIEVHLFKNTGFNAVNIPDSYSTLNSIYPLGGSNHFTAPSLDIRQDYGLPYVSVKASVDAVDGVDYVRVGDCCYFVTGPAHMTSNDVARLPLAMDYYTTATIRVGLSGLKFLDGHTNRVHVSDDTFGKYCQEDEYLAPSEPLKLEIKWLSDASAVSMETYVASTLNLVSTATNTTAVVYTDTITSGSVTVPTIVNATSSMTPTYTVEDFPEGGGSLTSTSDPSTCVYILSGDAEDSITAGMNKAKELGLENGGVNAKVSIPWTWVTAEFDGNGLCSSLEGKWRNWTMEDMPFEYATVNNKRALYGNNNRYGIMTFAGNSAESNPEEIYSAEESTCPAVLGVADPHLDGKPYFRFKYLNGITSAVSFFRNCIAGLPWKAVETVLEPKEDSWQTRMNFNYSKELSGRNYAQSNHSLLAPIGGDILGGLADLIFGKEKTGSGTASVGANAVAGGGSYRTGIGGLLTDFSQQQIDAWDAYSFSRMTHLYEQQREAKNYIADMVNQEPTVLFPYNSEFLRDFYGNGCLAYRYRYSDADLARIDKILTMYGYKYSKALETSDFTSRQYFNYIQADVSVGGNIPKWLADGVSSQLSGGIRIWHVKPDTNYYSNNPVA